MHVFEFLPHLFRAVDIEVVVSPLPESAQLAGCIRELQGELARRPAFSRAHRSRHPLLQDLHELREIPLPGLADEQMHVFRHHYIAHEERSAVVTHFFKSLHKEMASPDCAEQRASLVATEGDEMKISVSVMAFEFSRHEEKSLPPFPKTGKGRAHSYYYVMVN